VTVTAPPRPPATGDPVDWGDPEALIAEARQRARRRRRRYGVAVALLAVLATSLMVVFGRPEPPPSSLPEPPVLPVPADPDDAATIVAKFAKFHAGWVVVYADGRVLKYEMAGDMFERHLTAEGLDLVRSGAIQPRELKDNVVPQTLPADTWADREFKPYVPSRYAACLGTSGHPEWGIPPGQATHMVGRLPAAARPLLRDKELRTYRNDLFSHSEVGPPDHSADTLPPEPPFECFEVSTQEAIVLFKTLRQAGFAFGWLIGGPPPPEDDEDPDVLSARPSDMRPAPPPPWAGAEQGPCGGIKQPAAIVCFTPLLPHGQRYFMPG
jgi:hypothetical protein